VARFTSNRYWVLVFALGVSLACSVASFQPSIADGQAGGVGSVIDPTDPNESTPTVGDPDLPSGNGKSAGLGRASRHNVPLERRTVGDRRASRDAWAWRISILWQGFRRGYLLRF